MSRLAEILNCTFPVVEIVDIGAAPEGPERYLPLVEQGLARVIGFEPRAEALQVLNQRSGAYRYLPYCLGDGTLRTFHVTLWKGCCSLYEPDPQVINLFVAMDASIDAGHYRVVEQVPVQTARLDDVARVESLRPDYLKLDVQGAELDVLRHATNALESVLVLETETEFIPMYKGQPLFGDIQTFLREHGFWLHKLFDFGTRSFRPVRPTGNELQGISQLLWSDAVFVRDLSRLDRYADDQLLKAALVLNDAYRSADLVHMLLAEFDRRRNTDLAPRYMAYFASGVPVERLLLNERTDL
jgi:FkbM family methyltransferase